MSEGVGKARIWVIPLGPDGEPMMDEGVELGAKTRGFTFSPEEDWGSEDDLMEDNRFIELSRARRWTMNLELGSVPVETMALLWGMTVEEYTDMIRWMKEKRWLAFLTSQEWSLN